MERPVDSANNSLKVRRDEARVSKRIRDRTYPEERRDHHLPSQAGQLAENGAQAHDSRSVEDACTLRTIISPL